MNIVRKKNQKIFLIIPLFISFFFIPCFSNNNTIIELSKKTFSPNMPGLQETINSKNVGSIFELETALFVNKNMKEKIIGFSLDINFLFNDNKKHYAYVKNEKTSKNQIIELITTEYDVVTESSVIECKMGKKNKRKNFKQFRKEANTLLLFKKIKEELEGKKLSNLKFACYVNKKEKKIKILL
ncbi:hypothetical protein ACFLYH_03000 [Candidatus Dependentiae bacterium]